MSRESLKRTTAAYMIFIGLTAFMIGLYVNEFATISSILHAYSIPIP